MRMKSIGTTAAMLLAVSTPLLSQANQPARNGKPMMGDRVMAERMIARWPTRPRVGALLMIDKYGAPHEATAERLIWNDVGPFKRIAVMKLETPHDFPLPHVDFMEHTILYNVPLDKLGPLLEFDGSSMINRTTGELSARCDLEGHNVLTLNLNHDIVMGTKTVAEARKAFGDIVEQDVKGEHPPYVEALQFTPATMKVAAFPDTPVIPGSPMRVSDAMPEGSGVKVKDGSVLATVIAVDLNEILAAAHASGKKLRQPVLAYAKRLHEEHGKNMVAGMKLGQKVGVTPINTADVVALQKKGAGELAKLIPLQGAAFERAYLAAMVMGHMEVIAMLDNRLLPMTDNGELKKHLMDTRAHVAEHLAVAKSLQSTTSARR